MPQECAFFEFDSAIRSVRAEAGIEPKVLLEVSIWAKRHGVVFRDCIPVIARLGRVSKVDLSVNGDSNGMEHGATVVLDETFTLVVNLSQDGKRAEYERLLKQLQGVREYSAALCKRLESPLFLQKAKREVVETTRADVAKTLETISDLEKRLSFLETRL